MIRVVGSLAFDTVGSVERFASPHSTSRVRALATRCGGTAGNVAVALARFGLRVSLCSAVGQDFEASPYERRLAGLGVDLTDLVRAPGLSAHAFVWTDDAGDQSTYFYPGASQALAGAPVRAAPLAHFSAGEISAYPKHMEAADVVTFDPGQEVFHRPLEDVEACLPHVDVLFLNEHEHRRLVEAAGLSDAALWSRGLGALVVTRGSAGAEVRTPEGATRIPAVAARLVDPTGAGDAHRAGFLLGLSRGLGFDDCARLGAAAAAFAVEAVGPQEGLPTLEALRARCEEAFGRAPL